MQGSHNLQGVKKTLICYLLETKWNVNYITQPYTYLFYGTSGKVTKLVVVHHKPFILIACNFLFVAGYEVLKKLSLFIV